MYKAKEARMINFVKIAAVKRIQEHSKYLFGSGSSMAEENKKDKRKRNEGDDNKEEIVSVENDIPDAVEALGMARENKEVEKMMKNRQLSISWLSDHAQNN